MFRSNCQAGDRSALALEELHGTLVLLSRRSTRERAEIPSSTRAWISLASV
jgi:hypothetical protein